MDRTACTEPQCLYNGALYLYLYLYSPYGPYGLYRASVPVQVYTLPYSTTYTLCSLVIGALLLHLFKMQPCKPQISELTLQLWRSGLLYRVEVDASLPHLCRTLHLSRQISFITSVTKIWQISSSLKAKYVSDLLIGLLKCHGPQYTLQAFWTCTGV